jgi:pimeloyl-ACP methyl ester carboxylesterase
MKRTELLDAGTWLSRFERPVRIVWGTRDRAFKIGLGRRLAAAFPQSQLDEITDATTFVPVDRPEAVARAVRDVLAQPARHS